jgi:hypothetical protein
MSQSLRSIIIGISVLGLFGCTKNLVPPPGKTQQEASADRFECGMATKAVERPPTMVGVSDFAQGYAVGSSIRHKREIAELKNHCLKSRGWTDE